MNVALMDYLGDGYGVYASLEDANAAATRLSLRGPWCHMTTAPVNNGNDPENLGECNSHDGVHQFQNDPDPCIDWTDA